MATPTTIKAEYLRATAAEAALSARIAKLEARFPANVAVLASEKGTGRDMTSLTIHMVTGTVPSGKFIAPTGSDASGDGTIGSPWASIQKFYDSYPDPGATLYCRGGTYPSNRETSISDPAISGASGAPITVSAYPGETPVFPGGAGYNALHFDGGCAYHVIDGLHFTGYAPSFGAILWVGHTDGATYGPTLTHHITFRNLYLSKGSGGNNGSHGLYNSWMSDNVTLEDSVFIGASEFTGEQGGVHAYHPPNVTNLLVQRCVFKNWHYGMLLWDGDPPPTPRRLTANLLHNTFITNTTDIRLQYHAAITVRDNAFDSASGSGALYDPNDSASTTASYNFYSQTFNAAPAYTLAAGSSGINAASDGTDAGWKDA